VFLGIVTPFVLRPVMMQIDNKCRYYYLVGESYVHRVMRGEIIDTLDSGDIEKKEIILI